MKKILLFFKIVPKLGELYKEVQDVIRIIKKADPNTRVGEIQKEVDEAAKVLLEIFA